MDLDQILDKLIADVESSMHAFYRGEVRQDAQRLRTGRHRVIARDALTALIENAAGTGGAVAAVGDEGAAAHLSPDELAALTRCVVAWLPLGAPSTTSPSSRCLPAARELAPSWGEREKANGALKRLLN